MAATDIPKLHRFEDIAEQYDISLRSMKDGARVGRFEYTRFGQAWRMTDAQLEAFVAQLARNKTEEVDPLADDRARVAAHLQRKNAIPGQRKSA